jgi:hypothetical protein
VSAFTAIGCSVIDCGHAEKRATYLQADTAMSEHHADAHPNVERATLPKAATDLVVTAAEHGWRVAVGHGWDSGGSPFVTVQLGIADPIRQYQITWHTRGTGTYRLFSKIYRGERQWWADAPSVKAIRAYITETEVVAA